MSEPNNDRQHLTDHTLSPALAAKIPFKTFPGDRISDDKTVEDRIQAAVLAERERQAEITDGILVAAGRLRREYGHLHPGIESFVDAFERAAREIRRAE